MLKSKSHKKAISDKEVAQAQLQELEDKVRRLIWNIANQREKVPSNLLSLVKDIYPTRSSEEQRVIVEGFITNLK
jgi:hypothetical protein